ncbi:SURF1 family protein [Georgenia sp. TF02-10]|nr:SURF1 family protein [Georgenia sp. TF02-10]
MLVLLVVLLGAALVCVRLGAWQLDRAALRGAEAEEAAFAATLAAEPVPLDEVLRAQTSFTAEELGVPVTVRGELQPDQQVLVPGREVDGTDAVLVVTALRLTDGPDAGAMLPVLRGWLPAAAVSTSGGAAAPADAATAARLQVPAGEQELIGWLGVSEAAAPGTDLPAGMVGAVSVGELANRWGGPTFGGYLVQFAADGERPGTSPTGLPHAPAPGMAQESGMNLQNLAYAVEWVVFAGFALFVWWRMLRDDVAEHRAAAGLD